MRYTYEAKSGDTWSEIAQDMGVSVADLKKHNNKKNLNIGDVVRDPNAKKKLVNEAIESGATPDQLASVLKITPEELEKNYDISQYLQELPQTEISATTDVKVNDILQEVEATGTRKEPELFPIKATGTRKEPELFPINATGTRKEPELFPVQPTGIRKEPELFPVRPTGIRKKQRLFPVRSTGVSIQDELFSIMPTAQRKEPEIFPDQLVDQYSGLDPMEVVRDAATNSIKPLPELLPIESTGIRKEPELFPIQPTGTRKEPKLLPMRPTGIRASKDVAPETFEITNDLEMAPSSVQMPTEPRRSLVSGPREIPLPEFQDEVSAMDLARALYRTENSVGSFFAEESGLLAAEFDPTFNPFDYFTDAEKLDKKFVSNAALADNEEELNAVRRQSEQERRDRKTIADGGALSFVLGMGIGTIDPINLIPIGGAVAKTYRTGSSILRSGMVTGSIATASTAIQEAALHATQLERTYGESSINMGAAFLLGGTLGLGVGAVGRYIDDRGIKAIEDSMNVEPKIAEGKNPIFASSVVDDAAAEADFIAKKAAELISDAGSKMSRGDRLSLELEATDLQYKIDQIEAVPEPVTPKKGVSSRAAKAKAEKAGERIAGEEAATLKERLDSINLRLETDAKFRNAEANLSRLDQKIIPDEYRAEYDEFLEANKEKYTSFVDVEGQRNSIAAQAAAEGITPSELSAGAAKVADGVEVSGKVGKFLAKTIGFDPLSRTLTSANPATRRTANALAENPYLMDGGITNAAESLAKLQDGLYAAALGKHLDIYKAYRNNGGELKRKPFNEAVARAMRDEVSDIPEALQSAGVWRAELYDPLKKEMIDLNMLPEDVGVDTAVGYLNRSWNRRKIAAQLPLFVQRVSKYLEDEDARLFREAEQATKDLESIGADNVRPERGRDGTGRDQQPSTADTTDTIASREPLEGAPITEGATGPDAGINAAAERYARENGIDLTRQSRYVEVDEKFAGRLARAFESMADDPSNPTVQKAYKDLVDQTRKQYDALIEDGYEFTFYDSKTDPYNGNPYNAMRDLRNNKRMASYGTYDGYGTLDDFKADLKDPNRILLQDSGLRWKDQNGVEQIVTNNDLFRAVHDAFGHSMEGAGFRARGEENAFQAHAKLFKGPALRALATETRGQNSWLNYGPYGAKNRTAKIGETVFADQKMGLMPTWASKERVLSTPTETKRLQKIIGKAEYKKGLDLDVDNYEDIARQIARRIQSSPDGRLPYDWKMGDGSDKGNRKVGGTSLRGPLRNRTFLIPDKMVEEFLDNNIEDLGRMYLRATAVDIELTRKFGGVDMTAELAEMDDWYKQAITNAKTEKQRISLQKKHDQDVKDIRDMRDRLRGTYGQVDPDNPFVRANRFARNLNYMRFMGGVVASSVPDVARIFMAEGFTKTFTKGLIPLATNLKGFKVAAAEAKRYGVGVDALMGGRSQIIADVADYTMPNTAIERGMQSMTDNFGRINLMDYWTAGVKQIHAVTMQNSIIDGLLKGKIDKRLKRLGIDDANAENIARELKNNAEKVDGVWLSNAKNWDSPDLERMWGVMMRKESDRVIVIPGQEKPLFMSTDVGKTIWQFRSFMFASTQRMTIAALQGQDHNALGGVLMLTSLGMMSYAFKQWDAGRDIAEDPMELIIEGIDRSAVLGGLMEINNTLEKLSSNGVGFRPLLGVEQPAARFAARSLLDNLAGPTYGSLLEGTLRVGNAFSAEDEWKESDTRALRRLLPFQNLMILRQALDEVEEKIGDL
tara:strand:- start:667 stop:5916 length:5250 start_codon:yes stop_codon:yes gene_type:complete